MPRREWQRLLRLVSLALLLGTALVLACLLGFQSTLQARASDVFYGRPPDLSPRIAIVAMDPRSHEALVG